MRTKCFCRHCGYDLRASEGRCSECGLAFDRANPRTFRSRPPRVSLLRGARRIMIVLVVLTIAWVAGVLWLWHGWVAEQRELKSIHDVASLQISPLYPWVPKFLPSQWRFMAGRVGVLAILNTSDVDLGHLRVFAHLDHLALWGGPGVTDTGLACLGSMTRLEGLRLRGTHVTDAGLAHLAGLTRMQDLDLFKTKVTDSGLVYLKSMTCLQSLDLGETQVSDDGLVHLTGLTRIQSLVLSRTKVTDAGLKYLKPMTHLIDLNLDETHVTDAAVEPLTALASLKVIDIWHTAMTAQGLQRLREALPETLIEAGQ